ncbi:MAG: sugar ABC transporter substrate-binding protein [Hyphomicrobiaceae bacterium]
MTITRRGVAAGALAVAGSRLLKPGVALAQQKVVIGLSQPNLGWPYIAAYTRALQAAVAKDPNLTLVATSADGDIAKQSRDMESLVARKVNVLLVCSLDGNAIFPSIKAATDAKIPVLAVSNEPAAAGSALIAGYSGPDDQVQGTLAAELLHEALAGKGNIVVIEGTAGQSTTLARRKGFEERLKVLGSGLKVIARQSANWDPVKAKAVMEDFLTTHGDKINGLFSQDDNTAAAAAEVAKAAGKLAGIKIVGTGGSKNGIAAIKSGLLFGTVDQSPTADADQGLKLALELVQGKTLAQKRNIIPMPKITAANVAGFQGEW